MKRILVVLALLAGGESAALACSCVPPPTSRAQAEQMAGAIARQAVAFVEVDVLSAYDPRTGAGERMRVRRTLGGRAPASFQLERRGPPSSASCHLEYQAGTRAFLVIYNPDPRAPGDGKRFRESGLCTSLVLRDAGFRRRLVEAFRRRGAAQPRS
jgi:hypothetical protein